jgi:hypothetical protein
MPASFSLLLISSSISEYTHAHQEKHLVWELQNYGDGYNSNRTVEISDGSGKKLLMEFYLITYLFIYLFIVGFNKTEGENPSEIYLLAGSFVIYDVFCA